MTTNTNISALKKAIKLLADAAVDTEKVVATGASPLGALLTYRNLIPDVLALVPVIGELPAEAKDLKPEDYVALVQEFATDLAITDARASSLVDAGLALLQEMATGFLPKLEALAAAFRAHAVAPVAAVG